MYTVWISIRAFELPYHVIWSAVIAIADRDRVLEDVMRVFPVIFDDMCSHIVDSPAALHISAVAWDQRQRFTTAAAIRVLFSLLEERHVDACCTAAHIAITALDFRDTVRVLADKLAFRLRASWFVTLPVTFGLLADCFAFRLWSLAVSHAVRSLADCDTLGTVEHLAAFVWAFYLAFRLLAFDVTDCVSWFST